MPVSTATKTLPSALSFLEKEYVSQIGQVVEESKPYWGKILGSGGTLTNLESGMAWMLTLGNSGLESGCVGLQEKTYSVLSKHQPAGWHVARIVMGSVMEHHAVVVYEIMKKHDSGFLFDPWVDQAPVIFTFEEWKGRFPHYNVIQGPRLE